MYRCEPAGTSGAQLPASSCMSYSAHVSRQAGRNLAGEKHAKLTRKARVLTHSAQIGVSLHPQADTVLRSTAQESQV